jgi:hypothetical protein
VEHAPEGEPLFWRQPSCRLAAFDYRYAILVARLPRSGAPSPSAAGLRASLPDPLSFLVRQAGWERAARA